MGIPTLFRYLFEQYDDIVVYNKEECDYLFVDFNSILYKVFYENSENEKDEMVFINNIIRDVKNMCNNIIRPKKMIYFAMDGVAPRAKIVQQRSRRYKAVQLDDLFKANKRWNPSNHICPGTAFMYRFRDQFLKEIEKKCFLCKDVILNDMSFPGEGEHKILPIMKKLKVDDPDSSVCVVSPDNDLLSLGLLTMKTNVSIARYMDKQMASYLRRDYEKNKLVYIELNKLRDYIQTTDANPENMIIDYNFLLSMVGNDFIQSLPYMKIKSQGLDKLLQIYKTIFQRDGTYLIHKTTLDVNMSMFREIIKELSKKENNEVLILGSFIEKEKNMSTSPMDHDDKLSPEEIYQNQVQHLYLCNRLHPLFEQYKSDFEKVSFFSPSYEWKFQYYQHFAKATNETIYDCRSKMVKEYFKSLKFSLLYYNRECPSWSWSYGFRVPPLFSDIYYFLNQNQNFSFSDITFRLGSPLNPYEQLMLILPPQSASIVPDAYRDLFIKYKKYYPNEFRVDALQGFKYIYSEAVLPEWDCTLHLLSDIRQRVEKLSNTEKERNKISRKIYRFVY